MIAQVQYCVYSCGTSTFALIFKRVLQYYSIMSYCWSERRTQHRNRAAKNLDLTWYTLILQISQSDLGDIDSLIGGKVEEPKRENRHIDVHFRLDGLYPGRSKPLPSNNNTGFELFVVSDIFALWFKLVNGLKLVGRG